MKTVNEIDKPIRSRDPERTRAEILAAAIAEFSENGYDGTKIQKVASRAGCNQRLIYHYFSSKADLYLEALRHIYAGLRAQEEELNFEALPPRDAILRLVEFTFDFFESNTAFVSITRSENLLQGQFVSQLPEIEQMSNPLIKRIADLLRKGADQGVLREGVDALQLYVSIVALSAHHINATHTLSATFGVDLSAADWRRQRRDHVLAMVSAAISSS